MIGAFGAQQRGAVREQQFRRAAHAQQLRAVGQPQHSGFVDAGRQRQRRTRACGIVDRALQGAGLIVGAVRPHARLRRVTAERRGQRCGLRGARQHTRSADAGEPISAVQIHRHNLVQRRGARRVNHRLTRGRVNPAAPSACSLFPVGKADQNIYASVQSRWIRLA